MGMSLSVTGNLVYQILVFSEGGGIFLRGNLCGHIGDHINGDSNQCLSERSKGTAKERDMATTVK